MKTNTLISFATLLIATGINLCAQSTTANALQHPRDQIALQLGAIQMGYTVPFTLTGNISAPKMQQAVNALVMGRNSLNATVGAPAVQVQGAVDCPNVDTVEYRDQLYSAVEYVVTSPVVATIKGSATLVNSKKVTLSTTKLTVPPSAWTIPVPYALEARSSADVEALSGNVTDLASQLASIGGNLTTTVSTISGLSGNLTNLSTQVSSIGGNLSNTAATVSTLSGNLTSAQNSIQALSGNLGNLTTSVSSVTSNTTEVKAVVERLEYLKKSLVAQGIALDYSPSIVSTLASFNGTLAGLEFDGSNGIYIASNSEDGGGKIQKLSPQGVVTNFAGNDSNVPIDGTGSSALLPNPTSLRTDAAGNVYFIDGYTIRKVTPAGVVTTLAGSGSPGSADGTGAAASFGYISSLTLDSAGNIYVGDSNTINNNTTNIGKIRKVTPAGVVTTLAGSSLPGSADGTGAAASFGWIFDLTLDSAGNIYVADSNKIRKVTPAGVVTTLAGSPSFGRVHSLTLDSAGNVYVAERYSYRDGGYTIFSSNIRKVTPAGDVITLASDIGQINSLWLDSAGNVYVAERRIHDSGIGYTFENVILKVTPAGVVTTLAGSGTSGSADGTGAGASFSGLGSLTMDSAGNIYVADSNKIRKVTPAGVVTTLAGSGTSGSADGTGAAASFGGIGSLSLDSAGNIYVADSNKIRKVTPTGVVTTLGGGASPYDKDGTGASARMGAIASLVKDAAGNFYALDLGNNKIRKITPEGVVSTWAGSGSSGSPDAFFEVGSRLASDNSGNIYIISQYSIKKITSQGVITNFAGSNPEVPIDGTGTSALLPNPTSLRTDAAGSVYFVDGYTIRKLTPAGVVTTLAGSGSSGSADGTGVAASFGWLASLSLDSAGNIYVADNRKIRKVTPSGVVTTLAGSGSSGSADGTGAAASFGGLGSLTLDSAGNIYVADSNKIRKVTPAGVVTTLAGSGSSGSADGTGAAASFSGLGSLSLDSAGNIYVADNRKIRKVTPTGVVTTLAGSGTSGSDDGTGAAASFGYIQNLTLDSAGNIYLADNNNYKIRKVTPAGVVTTLAGSGPYGSADGTGESASFRNIGSLSLDSAGNIYVADSNQIRKVTPTGVVTTLAGSGSPGSADGPGAAASFGWIRGLTLDSAGNIYVADNNNYKIRKVTPEGIVTTMAGGASPYYESDGAGILARFSAISDFVIDSSGNFYLLTTWRAGDNYSAKIRKVSSSGLVTTIQGPDKYGFVGLPPFFEMDPPQWLGQSKMTLDSAGNLYVGYFTNTSFASIKLAKVTSNGLMTTFAGSGLDGSADGPGTFARFQGITGLAVDSGDNILVNEINRVRKVKTNGIVSTLAGNGPYGAENGSGFDVGFLNILAMKIDGSGNIYVVDGPGVNGDGDVTDGRFKVIKISPQ